MSLPENVVIRRLEEKDVETVAENEKLCFSQPWAAHNFQEALARNDLAYVVTEVDGKVVGHAGVFTILGEGEIINVAIHPDYRGRGLAYKMLSKLLEVGLELDTKDYTLEVRAGNAPAIHLYEKLGFVTEGVRPGFYDFPKEDALIMWKRRGI